MNDKNLQIYRPSEWDAPNRTWIPWSPFENIVHQKERYN